MSRKQPETSLEAYHALTPEKLRGDYKKILDSLKVLGVATYEEISDYTNCREPNVVSRRMRELELMGMVFKPGGKRLTKRNRNAFLYQLSGTQPKTENKTERVMDGNNIAYFAQNIAKIAAKSIQQPELFK